MILSDHSAQLALFTLDGTVPCEGPRPVSLSRHHDENPVPARPEGRRATPFVSHSYKCPLPQLLSFDNLTNARGVWGAPNISIFKCVFCIPDALAGRSTFHCPPFLFSHLRTLLLFGGGGVPPVGSLFRFGLWGSLPFRPAPVLSCGRNLLLKTYD